MPTLAPELAALPDHHRLIWADPQARREALEAIVAASEHDSPALPRYVAPVDDAVVAALDALGLPRGLLGMWPGRYGARCLE